MAPLHTTSPTPVRLDPAAIARVRRRLAAAKTPPWLHAEVANRMAERLSIFRQAPHRVLDWSFEPGPPAAGLARALPRAELRPVLADGALPPATAWWRQLGGPFNRRLPGMPVAALPAASADMIWSNMALHLEPDPRPLMQAWRSALASEGFVLFSTIGPGSLGLLRDLYAQLGWGPAHAPLVDMHDLGDMLVESGFADPVMDQETLRLSYTRAETLLTELRALGGNLAPQRHPGCRTPRWRARLIDELERRADSDGRIVLEVELVYGHAFRAPDRGPLIGGNTEIALDDMKLMLRKGGPRK